MRILIVDDSDTGRDVADAMLSMGGYDIVGARSAREAYDYLHVGVETGEPPTVDAILLDVVMPGTNGIEACAHIRKDERYRDTPIIMVTALDEMGSLANAFIAGATDYVTKPLNRTEILARVRTALKLKGELERARAREQELLVFMSIWVDRRAGQWIDTATGLFAPEVAEAYLIAAGDFAPHRDISIIALSVDDFERFRLKDEKLAARMMAEVADAVRGTRCDAGVLAAAYRDGSIVLIAPDHASMKAAELAANLRQALAETKIGVSASVVTGRPCDWSERVHLLTRAIATIPLPIAAGRNGARQGDADRGAAI